MTGEQEFQEWVKTRVGKITFEEAMAKWDELLEPEREAAYRAEQLTAADYNILGSIRWKL